MRETFALDGQWKLGWAEYCGDRPSNWLDARVPGDVHLDLMRHGLLPDVFVGTNLEQAWWVETKDWWYTLEFDSPAGSDGRDAALVFHGLDAFASVWLNRELLGRSNNMFVRQQWPVTGKLRTSGRNELVIRLASTKHSVTVDPEHRPMAWSPERFFCRKAQMSFGWDIAPRLVTAGIWRPVELVLSDRGRITGARLTGASNVVVCVDVEWNGDEGTHGRLDGMLSGRSWGGEVRLRRGAGSYEIPVEAADLAAWWPRGYGDANMHLLSAELTVGGAVIDAIERKVGLRQIEIVQEPQAGGRTSFRFMCNSRPVFITGLNWTPLDAIFARVTPERITQALEDLAGIGCNMLRVWGGGVYESDHFYSECDRLGIMIWQDFMMACGWYPQTEEFAAMLENEARTVVRDLRHHPCIAVWSGDNENDAFYPELAKENMLTRKVLAAVCAELDPTVPYVPSSPYSPKGGEPNGENDGDLHRYIHGKGYTDPEMWDLKPRFISEFGYLSLPSMDLIAKYMPEPGRWPLTSPLWRYHAADTIRVSMFRGPEMILKSLAAMGRPAPESIEEAVRVSQELQAEAVSAWIERFCEDPDFGGFLLWNVSDCWPQQSDSVTEYGGKWKVVFRKLGPLFEKVRRTRDQG